MAEERLNPLNDYIFLKIMGEKGDADCYNKDYGQRISHRGKQTILN